MTVRDSVKRNSGDLPVELRKVLDAVPVGQTTAPEVTRLGVELFAICGKEETKADSAGSARHASRLSRSGSTDNRRCICGACAQALIEQIGC